MPLFLPLNFLVSGIMHWPFAILDDDLCLCPPLLPPHPSLPCPPTQVDLMVITHMLSPAAPCVIHLDCSIFPVPCLLFLEICISQSLSLSLFSMHFHKCDSELSWNVTKFNYLSPNFVKKLPEPLGLLWLDWRPEGPALTASVVFPPITLWDSLFLLTSCPPPFPQPCILP